MLHLARRASSPTLFRKRTFASAVYPGAYDGSLHSLDAPSRFLLMFFFRLVQFASSEGVTQDARQPLVQHELELGLCF
jgi:hypothetical protein